MSSSIYFIAKIKNCRDLSVVLDFCPLFSWLFFHKEWRHASDTTGLGLGTIFLDLRNKNRREVLILQEAEQLRAELRLRVTSGSRTFRGLEMVMLEETEKHLVFEKEAKSIWY